MRGLAAACVLAALALAIAGIALGIYGMDQASRTAAALRADVSNVTGLVRDVKQIQLFDHHRTIQAQRELAATVRAVEQHLDHTIRTSIDATAKRFAHELHRR